MDKESSARPWSCCCQPPDCDIILNMTTSGDIHADDTTRRIHLSCAPNGFL